MKIRNVIVGLFVFVVVIVLACFICWNMQEKSVANIYVLDKTLPSESFNGHKSFYWILNNLGVKNLEKKSYCYKTDYYGFVPNDSAKYKYSIKSLRLSEILSIVDDIDVAYFTDTYGGIYTDSGMHKTDTVRFRRSYGGLNQNDYLMLSELCRKKKLIISEFNLFDYPTSDLIRQKTEGLFEITYTGWVGGYIKNLDKNSTPTWIVEKWEHINNSKWEFVGSGIVLLNRGNKIIVLENEKHLHSKYPIINVSEKGQKSYKLPENQNYPGWFDIIITSSANEQIASFNLPVNQLGLEILKSNNIPIQFPAVIEHLKNYKFYYFAGDFAKRSISMNSSYFCGVAQINNKLYSNNAGSQNAFFWRFYNPLISNILKNNNIHKNKLNFQNDK